MRNITRHGIIALSLLALACGAVAAAPATAAPVASVPLESHGPVSVIAVRINGEGPFTFVIDTGATVPKIDHEIVKQLGLISDREPQNGESVSVEVLTVGDLRLQDVKAESRDVHDMFGDEKLDGVIGLSAFAGYLVTVDLPLQELRFAEGELPPPDGAEVLAYTLAARDDSDGPSEVPTLAIEVAGQEMTVDLDPAGFGSLTLHTDLADSLPLSSAPETIGRINNGEGQFPILGAALDGSISIGAHEIARPGLFFSEAFDDPTLGSRALGTFVITFDQANTRVRIQRLTGRDDPLVLLGESLRPQSGEGETIKVAFNRDLDKVRFVTLLSPT